MGDQCIFCKIVNGDIPSTVIYEDDDVYAFLDIGPISEGHCLVIPKEHYSSLSQCPGEITARLARQLGPIAAAVVKAVGADGYNVLCNNGRSAGQLVGHLHFHIIPRRQDDGVFQPWPAGEYAAGRMEAVAQQIRAQL